MARRKPPAWVLPIGGTGLIGDFFLRAVEADLVPLLRWDRGKRQFSVWVQGGEEFFADTPMEAVAHLDQSLREEGRIAPLLRDR